MKKRIISAVIALIIVIPIIILGGKVFSIGATILGCIGVYELVKCRNKKRKIPNTMFLISIISFLLLTINNWNTLGSLYVTDYTRIPLIIIALILPIVFYNKSKKYDIEDALYLLGGVLFLGVGFNELINIRLLNINYLVYLLLITIITDTFAYVTGKLIGKNKMCKSVSPNKTWEGFAGGLVFGTVVSTIYYVTVIGYTSSLFKIIILSMILSILGQLGDLVFSSIKRHYDIKDFGNIMPGHGGILDRLDSIIFVVLSFGIIISYL